MFRSIDSWILAALKVAKSGAKSGSVTFRVGAEALDVPFLDVGAERYLFIKAEADSTIDAVTKQLRQVSTTDLASDGVSSVKVALGGHGRFDPRPLTLGVTLAPLIDVIARLSGLPDDWIGDQEMVLHTTLEPVESEGGDVVPLRGEVAGTEQPNVLAWFEDVLHGLDDTTRGRLIYVRAEAGRGKSTVLASLVKSWLKQGEVPLPLFVPLRQLARGRGISWQDIVRGCGIVGANADRLSAAVRQGLVMVVLDGLDEIAGRYDPEIVRQVLSIASKELVGERSRVIISGRTTEAQQIDRERALIVGLELPDTDSDAFSTYVEQVVDRTVANWGDQLLEVPADVVERLIPGKWEDVPPPTQADRRHIKTWIVEVFDEFGRDRSLFFVQSLAGIGRCKQVDGNQVLFVPGQKQAPASAPIYDVTLLAAALACVREESKVEEVARKYYTAEKQLDVLTYFAVLAVMDDTLRQRPPTPNDFAASVFGVDPVNQTEEFTAIVRQNQKHALLFSTNSSPTVGDWRPDFLSEWVRGALLVRAWLYADRLPGVSADFVRQAVVRAKRSRLAFAILFPDLFRCADLHGIQALVSLLRREIDQNSPEACANFWFLWAGLSDKERSAAGEGPGRVIDGTDLTGAVFENMTFGREFSPQTVFISATTFDDCCFDGTSFRGADLSGVLFRRCQFKNVVFDGCDGPETFENSTFETCSFLDTRTVNLPALTFAQCNFLGDCSIEQNVQPTQLAVGTKPLCAFDECEIAGMPAALCRGDWTGINTATLQGLTQERRPEERDLAEECARALLKPFFPRRAGVGGQVQVRRYIRSSALGRGVFPPNPPSYEQLKQQLESIGFTSGGREAHIYAPWAPINGVREEDLKLRQELLTFMLGGKRGPKIEQLIRRLRVAMGIVYAPPVKPATQT